MEGENISLNFVERARLQEPARSFHGPSAHQLEMKNLRCPSIRAKAVSRTNFSWRCDEHRFFAREVEDQDSGNLTLNHLWRNIVVPPTIDSTLLVGRVPHPCAFFAQGWDSTILNPWGFDFSQSRLPLAEPQATPSDPLPRAALESSSGSLDQAQATSAQHPPSCSEPPAPSPTA